MSDWTVDTLKEYFDDSLKSFKDYVDKLFAANKSALENTLTATTKAIDKEEENSKAWRSSANEWRGAMVDREMKFVTKDEFKAELKGLKSSIFMMIISFIVSLLVIGGTAIAILKGIN